MMNITTQISYSIETVSNRKSDELLSSLAPKIAMAVIFQYERNDRNEIMIKMPAKVGSLYHFFRGRGSGYEVWERKILPLFSETELKTYAKELGINLYYVIEDETKKNAHYELWFNYLPEEKPITKVQILARQVIRHYKNAKKVEQKRKTFAEKNSRIEYLSNAPTRKKERLQAYKVYMECMTKLLSRNFEVDCSGQIIIQLKSSNKFDMRRLNKFLDRIGLECLQQQLNTVILRQLQPTQNISE